MRWVLRKRLLQDEKLWEDNYLIEVASESFGNQEVMAALEKESLTIGIL